SARLSPDGHWLATEARAGEGVVTVWEVQTGQRKLDLTIKGARYIMPVTFSPDGKQVAAVGHARSKFVRVWRLEDGKEVFAKDVNQEKGPDQPASTPAGTRLLASVGSGEHGMYCWDRASGELVWQNKKLAVQEWVLPPDGRAVCTGNNGPHRVVDLNTGEPLPP